jgi:CelD/BcsL family acetyltransferase involved in cellulose biosynthesis
VVEEPILARTQEINGDGGAAPSFPFEVEIVRDIARFNSLADEWNRLVEDCAIDRVFLSHTWFRTWWEMFGEGNELYIVIVRSAGRLVAAAPMMRTRANVYGFGVNTLHAIYNPHTPRYDFIVGAGQHPRLYDAIWRNLIAHSNCDAIILAQIPDGSRTIAAVEKAAKHQGWLTGQWTAPVSPFIPLSCDYETFFNSLRSGCRFNLSKRFARLRRIGPVDVEVVTEPHAVDMAMLEGLRIEASGWKGRLGTAMLSDPIVAEFYRRLARRQARLGQLRLTFLRVGGKRISFNYLLENRKKLYAVKIGYDPEFHAYSPGNMLLNLILQDACNRGIEEYDLLGGADEWKFDWTNAKREHRWLFLFRNGVRPRFLHGLKFGIVPMVKRLMSAPL